MVPDEFPMAREYHGHPTTEGTTFFLWLAAAMALLFITGALASVAHQLNWTIWYIWIGVATAIALVFPLWGALFVEPDTTKLADEGRAPQETPGSE